MIRDPVQLRGKDVDSYIRNSGTGTITLADAVVFANTAANQRWNRRWSLLFIVVIFGLILPFCLTAEPQPWTRVLRDMVVILMFYDFFYYLTHRFLFHDSDFLGGPLKWMHAIHHRRIHGGHGGDHRRAPLSPSTVIGLKEAARMIPQGIGVPDGRDAAMRGPTVRSVVDYGVNRSALLGGTSVGNALKRPSPRLEAARYSASRENCTRGGGEGGGTAARAARTRATGAMYRSLTCL